MAGDCSIIERLRASAAKRFTDIQGVVDEFGDATTTYVMPGAKCDISKHSYAEHSCRWYSTDKESIKADFDVFVSSTRPCLRNAVVGEPFGEQGILARPDNDVIESVGQTKVDEIREAGRLRIGSMNDVGAIAVLIERGLVQSRGGYAQE